MAFTGRLFAQKKAYQGGGGGHGHPRSPLATPLGLDKRYVYVYFQGHKES